MEEMDERNKIPEATCYRCQIKNDFLFLLPPVSWSTAVPLSRKKEGKISSGAKEKN